MLLMQIVPTTLTSPTLLQLFQAHVEFAAFFCEFRILTAVTMYSTILPDLAPQKNLQFFTFHFIPKLKKFPSNLKK
jgi:hypothetical protein